MSFARIFFYECAENLLSFARFNCAFFFKLLLQVTRTFNSKRAHDSNLGIWVELDRPSAFHDTRTGR